MTSFISMQAQEEIKLYPGGAAESNGITEEKWRDSDFLMNVNEARMYRYSAPENKATGAAVLICPGGGYGGVSAVKEGKEFAEYFNNLGISAFVLYYRMPNGHREIPLKDAQTALQLIRKQADDWKIDREQVGVAGFSAGGHLASTLGTHFTSKENRPDFMILLYPVITMKAGLTHVGSRQNLLGMNASDELLEQFSNELRVSPQTPVTFIVAASDDNAVPIGNSQAFSNALRKNNVPVLFKTYQKGGHGFGLRKRGLPVDNWTKVLEFWLKSYGYAVED
ncbi:MAG: alpha/beta hydrolase [Prevotellaceae bacterium]|nr:alpha/beta hydrolase [Prevotellaceae bacterium]